MFGSYLNQFLYRSLVGNFLCRSFNYAKREEKINMKYVANLIKDLVVLIGISYLYFWKGVSGWWWVLALALVFSAYPCDDEDKK